MDYKGKAYLPGQLRVWWEAPCKCGSEDCDLPDLHMVYPQMQEQLDIQLARLDSVKHPYKVEAQNWTEVGP